MYIQEAHPQDGWQVPANLADAAVFDQPSTMDERAQVAKTCVLRLSLAMPTLLDDIDNTTDTAYAALPERLYVVDTDGRVAYKCGLGPFGFDVSAWEAAIAAVAG